MCGIAGIMYRGVGQVFDTGEALIQMLDGCQHRGPDSTGFALYAPEQSGRLKMRFFLDALGEPAGQGAVDAIRQRLTELGAIVEEEAKVGDNYRVTVRFGGDVQKLSYEMEHAAKVISIGASLEIGYFRTTSPSRWLAKLRGAYALSVSPWTRSVHRALSALTPRCGFFPKTR